MELYLCLRVYACYLNIPDISFTSASFAWESVSVIYNSIFDIFETMQIDYSSVVIFPDSMAIGRIVHYNFSVSLPGNHGYGLTVFFFLCLSVHRHPNRRPETPLQMLQTAFQESHMHPNKWP